jgi:peptide deformylase
MFVAGGHQDIEKGLSLAMFNPMIISVGVDEIMMKEGCLTYPYVFLNVKRPRKVVMKYEDAEGKTQEAHLDGMMSRICQHEYDHTIGRNFTEHVSKFKLKRAQEKAIKEIDRIKRYMEANKA